MDLYKIGLKAFVENPDSLKILDFIPVFHRWIQNQELEGHLLIDVHNYTHIEDGPGVLLVAYEGNLSLDQSSGRPGLLHYRKQPTDGSFQERLTSIFHATLNACRLLESDSSLGGVRFKSNELLLLANDRLQAPNTEETFNRIRPTLSKVLERLYNGNQFTLSHISSEKERFTISITSDHMAGTQSLLENLGKDT